MRHRTTAAALMVFAAVCGTTPPTSSAPDGRRVVLVSLDGGADWLVDRFIAEGKAPAFARMAAEGAAAEGLLSVWPSLTAAAHATLWTGAPPRVHGVPGNEAPVLPASGHTILEQQSGYLSSVLAAEPIWIAAARAGRRVLVLQATQGAPFTGQFPDRLLQFDVFGNELARVAIVEGSLTAGPHAFAVGDETAVLEAGPDGSVLLTIGQDRAQLAPRAGKRWSPTLRARAAGRTGFFRAGVLRYEAASGAFVLMRGRVSEIISSDPAERDAFVRTAGTMMDWGLLPLYQRGRLGPTLAAGGKGEAEETLAEAISINQEYADGALGYAASQRWDLLVAYNPGLDLVQHALVGMIDPASSAYQPALAERVWPYLAQMFARCADDYVALLRRRFPDAIILVVSDHGAEGTGRKLYPNAILAQAGLLHLGEDGTVDLSRTKAVYLDGRPSAVTINGTWWKSGIVREADRGEVKRAIAAALLEARDPQNGVHVVRAVFDPERDGEALGFGSPGVDLIFDAAPDYATSAALGRASVAERAVASGEGEHGPAPFRRKLHGIFYAAGPGLRAGTRLPIVQPIDVAPTVAALLGIEPPRNAVGRALPLQ
jgi:predicted AlkP superfamily phosphohydrolase/phosphomutase